VRPLTLAAAAVAVALLLFLAERRWPLRRPRAALLARLAVNLLVAAIALAVAAATVRPLVLRALGLAAQERVGLFAWLPWPPPLEAGLAFLLLDMSFYWWHRVNHRVPLLWRFHNVHHFDPDLDVSTALRFHFVEIALSAVFRVAQVVLLGLGPAVYWTYELCFQANTLFHHSNVRLPIGLERVLNRVMVTPRMHGIHHSQVEAEAMSNYGVLLPWWDRLHRTLRLNVPQRAIDIGVPAYARPEDSRARTLMTAPFAPQREYWRRRDGTPVERGELPGPVTKLAE
jgi:sterol desaturase/sphingolipid hydroxylase (fatty acid hydroxylase superfamily)